MNTCATLTPTLSLAEGEGVVSIPSPPEGERDRVRGRIGRGARVREWQAGGRVTPETWTHGSARQRAGWFRRGLESGRMQDCDTFRTALPGVEDRAPLRAR